MPKIFVGMSGGIDSSFAAFLLKQQGLEVYGITFVGPQEEGAKKCCTIEDVKKAKEVCNFLHIEHKVINLEDIFSSKIISYFIKNYENGLTPNPCILCNRFIKFGALLEYSLSEGADFFATGHYAQIKEFGKEILIKRGRDLIKDQSYFLSYIEKDKLQYIKLPLGKFNKKEIKKMAIKNNLPINPEKPESQDICFIKNDYREFLIKKGVPKRKGNFIYEKRIVGTHDGVPFYSFGQRRGLKIALGERVFVRELNTKKNEIIVGKKPISKEFIVNNINIFTEKFQNGAYGVQFRYQSPPEQAQVFIDKQKIFVKMKNQRELVTPGQFAVFYKNNYIYASGIIESITLD